MRRMSAQLASEVMRQWLSVYLYLKVVLALEIWLVADCRNQSNRVHFTPINCAIECWVSVVSPSIAV